MSVPLVSVLMAAYNSEKYIGEAIESVLASTFTDFELIICDDRSTDNTAKIAQGYLQKDSRVKVYINETNLGDYPNRNKAASYATGTYLKYLDHDDVIYPWGLGVMVKCMQAYPSAGFGLICSKLYQQSPFPILVNSISAYRHYFFDSALLIGPTGAIIRKDAFDSINGFSGKPFVGDVEMWLTLSQKFDMIRMPNDLIWYRLHEMQESKRELLDPLNTIRRYKLFEWALKNELCPLPENEKLIALENHKKVSIRLAAINNLKSFSFLKYYQYCKACSFTFLDFCTAFTKAKKPKYT
jgi:glycosyltransferase involved in cell wall biosynthesis